MDDEKNDGNEIPVFRSSSLWSFCHLVSNKPQLVCDGGNSGGYSQVKDTSSMAFFDMVAAPSKRGLKIVEVNDYSGLAKKQKHEDCGNFARDICLVRH
jgi:hypothetical protein